MWTHRLIAQLVAALAVVLALSLPAHAAPSDLDAPDVTKGERGAGLDVDVFDTGDDVETVLVPGVSYAPTDWLDLALEAGFADVGPGGFEAEALTVEAIFAPANQDGPWRLGAKLALETGLEEGVPESVGVTLLATRPIGALTVLGNLGFGQDLGGGSNLAADYGLRLEGPVGRRRLPSKSWVTSARTATSAWVTSARRSRASLSAAPSAVSTSKPAPSPASRTRAPTAFSACGWA